MRNILIAATLVGSSMRVGGWKHDFNLSSGDWALQFEDDFNGAANSPPNPAIWTAANRGGYTGQREQEWYEPSRVYLDGNSNLVLFSQPESINGYNYTSGWVDSQQKWNATYGRWEVRAKLPTGQGVWPAHWLMPDWTGNGSCWPAAGEIDIMERIDTVYMVHGALHWSGNGSCGTADEKNGGNWSNTLPFDPSDDFHTYGVVWTNVSFAPPSPGYAFSPDSLYYYIDEDIYTSVSNVSLKFPQRPFHWILNTAIGGDWPGPPNATTVWPQLHLIDYVRWYTWSGQ